MNNATKTISGKSKAGTITLTATRTEHTIPTRGGGEGTRVVLTVDHGLVDEKSRKVGGKARIDPTNLRFWSHRIELTAEELAGGFEGPVVPGFEVSIFALRDGNGYGAIPTSTIYRTLEEAEAHADKGLINQHKSYQKKYGTKAA